MLVDRQKRHLSIRLDAPSTFLSWCLHGGGLNQGQSIFWAQVRNHELTRDIRPSDYLKKRWEDYKLQPDLAFMTSADISDAVIHEEAFSGLNVTALTTVGMGNALRAGDPGGYHLSLGTINLLLEINATLSPSALVEAMAIATEGKTAAVMDSSIPSKVSGNTSTGTGTDCLAISSHQKKTPMVFCGKHTKLGELIGKASYQAVLKGVSRWVERKEEKSENRERNDRHQDNPCYRRGQFG